MGNVGQFAADSQSVFDAQHDALAPLALVAVEVFGGACLPDIVGMALEDAAYLVEYQVGVGCRRVGRQGRYRCPCLACLGLGQIGHHRGRIKPPVGHFVQVDEDSAVASAEVDALGEKHGGVAVGIEGEHTVVQLLGAAKLSSTVDEPSEQAASVFAKPLGMPLHTKDIFEAGALHRLHHRGPRPWHGTTGRCL